MPPVHGELLVMLVVGRQVVNAPDSAHIVGRAPARRAGTELSPLTTLDESADKCTET